MTTEAGTQELRELADDLVVALAGRSSQFVVSGTFHGQHGEFADRAAEFAQYIQGALVLRDRRLFAPAFGLLRSALDHWAADLVAMLGDRFVQHYENATEEQLTDAVTRWRQGELPSIVEEHRLVGKGRSKLRIVRRGMTSEDGSIVLHPMYFEMDSFDPFFGPPDEQPEFADWLAESDPRGHATEQRQRYNAFLRWGALVDSLILNEIVTPDHRVHLNVHHRFLSAFVHSHRAAHQLLAWSRPINGPAGHHVTDELVLLYAVQLSATYLRAFVEMTQRPPEVGIAGPRDPGDLGPPVLPLRHPLAHVRRRRPRRPRSRPGLLRRRPAHLTPFHRPRGRLSPLRPPTPPSTSGATPSPSSSPGSSHHAGPEPTPASSNASTPDGTSNDPATATGLNPIGHPTKPSRSLIERY